MFMYLRFILTLALLSVVAHPAVAHRPEGALVSFANDEFLEIAVTLLPFEVVEDQRQFVAADRCRVQFTIETRSATDAFPSATKDVDLAAGQTEIHNFDFHIPFVENGPILLILTVTDFVSSGPCPMSSSGRIVAIAGGETRAHVHHSFQRLDNAHEGIH